MSDPILTAAAEAALAIVSPDWLDEAASVIAAVRPLIEAEVREQIAARVDSKADYFRGRALYGDISLQQIADALHRMAVEIREGAPAERSWPLAPAPAFSNGTDWEMWSAANCWRCTKDDGPGADPLDGDKCCPIINDLIAHVPNDALRRDPDGLTVVCLEFTPDPEAER